MPPEQQALTSVLSYEVRSSVRYRRCCSLMVWGGKEVTAQEDGVFNGDLRQSDAVFQVGDKVAVLMGETSLEGALRAVNRLKERFTDAKRRVWCGVASFPTDGDEAKTIMYCAFRRCQDARMQGSGSVISKD